MGAILAIGVMLVSLDNDITFYNEWHQHALEGENKLKTKERQDLLRRILKNMRGPFLVVGCGGANEMSVLPGAANGVGIDISHVALRKSKNGNPHHSFVLADASHLPFQKKRFRTLVCSEVIEHVRNSDDALREFSRVLDDQGSLVLTTPNWLSFYGLARMLARLILRRDLTSGDQPYDRWTTRRALDSQLQTAGFQPREWVGLWFFPPFGKGERRISDKVVAPVLRKFMFVERRLRRHFPSLGHILVVDSQKVEKI